MKYRHSTVNFNNSPVTPIAAMKELAIMTTYSKLSTKIPVPLTPPILLMSKLDYHKFIFVAKSVTNAQKLLKSWKLI